MRTCKITLAQPDGSVVEKDQEIYNFREIELAGETESNRLIHQKSHPIIELDHCPFCGWTAIMNYDPSLGYYGWCSVCGATGPNHRWNAYAACKMWNSRTLSCVVEQKDIDILKLVDNADITRFTATGQAYIRSLEVEEKQNIQEVRI